MGWRRDRGWTARVSATSERSVMDELKEKNQTTTEECDCYVSRDDEEKVTPRLRR